ncbi:MAG: outer membrane beta-barrel protein [Bacteroidaceae bacterium]|nr:outer membrane beta-barrel protein [Bacteroidaceae bacterium]
MKKFVLLVLLTVATTSAFAQFEKGTKYVGASLTGLNMAINDRQHFSFGLDAKAGYFIKNYWMVEGTFGWHTSRTHLDRCQIGAKLRYAQVENGLYYACGLKYIHERKSFNDLQLTPELGYCYYLNHYISVEPAVYYDMSFTDFSKKSEVGLKVGIGIYF